MYLGLIQDLKFYEKSDLYKWKWQSMYGVWSLGSKALNKAKLGEEVVHAARRVSQTGINENVS